jgi:pheromone shutdown-related protein TraB
MVLENLEIILIGTAHVSQDSIDEVRKTIQEEKPQQVCVELDEGRYAAISRQNHWENLDMVKVFKEGKGFLFMANLVLSGFQRRMGAELGVKPGEEMKAALETANELGIPHSLCDREIQITLRRAWANCSLWTKTKLLASLLSGALSTEKMSSEEIEGLKNQSELDSMMAELADYLPAVKETLIDERDRYLASKIWSSASAVDSSTIPHSGIPGEKPQKKIIAVVGAGHMQGIRSHLEGISAGKENVDLSRLDLIPSPSFFSKAIGFVIPGIIIALIIFGFFQAGAQTSLSMVLRWILWNGSLAALGTIIALGHPIVVLLAFLGAPITSLNPFLGVGIITGIVQASLKKPRVIDAQRITEDVGNLKGIYQNRITHALLVFFLSSMGSVAGSFISIPSVVGVLLR